MQTKLMAVVALLPALALASCEGGWMDEDRTNYLYQCRTGNAGLYADSAHTERYCQCNLDSVTAIYPVFNDLVRNKDSVRVRRALLHCSEMAQR